MEHVAHVNAASNQPGACRLEVIDHEERSLNRSRRGGREPLAEHDGARRAGRRHLHQPPIVTAREVGVRPPTQVFVEAFGPIDIGHRNDDHLDLQIGPGGGAVWVASAWIA